MNVKICIIYNVSRSLLVSCFVPGAQTVARHCSRAFSPISNWWLCGMYQTFCLFRLCRVILMQALTFTQNWLLANRDAKVSHHLPSILTRYSFSGTHFRRSGTCLFPWRSCCGFVWRQICETWCVTSHSANRWSCLTHFSLLYLGCIGRCSDTEVSCSKRSPNLLFPREWHFGLLLFCAGILTFLWDLLAIRLYVVIVACSLVMWLEHAQRSNLVRCDFTCTALLA